MKTKPRRTCPRCGNRFSGAMAFCPVCMVREAIDWGAESGKSSSEKTAEPGSENAAQRFEHYELVRGEGGQPVELGRGGMGVTYKAFDVDLQYAVALKVISERYLSNDTVRLRFLRSPCGSQRPSPECCHSLLVAAAYRNPMGLIVLVALIELLSLPIWAVLTPYLAESFRTRIRSSGYGVSYSLAAILPGLYSFYMLGLAKLIPYEYSPILLLALGGLLLSVGALADPETKDADFRSD